MQKVLLVEDDPLIIRLYTRTLQMEGYNVLSAENGLSALEQLPNFNPDIILLDIMMPTMNGIEFLKNISAGTEDGKIPVIVLTNVADSDVTMEAVQAGASLILIKSQTEPDDVVSAVKGVLAKELLQVESLEPADDTSTYGLIDENQNESSTKDN
ncbi:MAG TPA: response regulator [Candidatus Saccharimonadales bacterium]|nr:response regulator [Candidatus Saccharimonadales bacterium]